MDIDWKKLQNGSDIRGVAIDGVQGEQINLSKGVVEIIAKAFVIWLRNKGTINVSIAVGMDSRLSGPDLKTAFIKGVKSQGANIYDCGMASTPAMFMATLSQKISVNASVMLTASHLPFNRNGLKFFTQQGGLDKKDITAILEIASVGQFPANSIEGSETKFDLISEYSNNLVNIIREKSNSKRNYNQPLKGLKIIVDAGNGAGGFFAHKVLLSLGVDISGSQFLEPDGNFPNHVPNPEDAQAMQSICDAVKNTNANLGVIFDTDVDRAAVVDNHGNPINRNALIALISAIIIDEHPGSTVVTDSITSEGLTWFINEKLKGKHHRFKRGYKNVINESIRLNAEGIESWIAIETSGHAALKENYFLDDGSFLIAKLLIKMAQMRDQNLNFMNLISDLPLPKESEEFRLTINSPDFIEYGNSILKETSDFAATIKGWILEPFNYEGIRVKCMNDDENGWFLIRMSLHDPEIPINIESNVTGGIRLIANKLNAFLSKFNYLDIRALGVYK
jgi:phosphomannomutase